MALPLTSVLLPAALALLPVLPPRGSVLHPSGTVGPDEPARLGFDVLADFEHKQGQALPKSVTKFHKQKVTVAGFMERENPGNGPMEFFLIINDACGCTGAPMINEIVFCATPPGKKTSLKPGLVRVTGTLYVKEQYEQGQLVAVYALDADSINGTPLAPAGGPARTR